MEMTNIHGMRELNKQEMSEVNGGWLPIAWAITWRAGAFATGFYMHMKADQK